MRLAEVSDAGGIATVQAAAADALTAAFGRGHWSNRTTERGAARALERGRVVVARDGVTLVACATLSRRKPWAIDPSYFSPVDVPLYLTGMAVLPEWQRRGVGRALLDAVRECARAWPADAIRLDAYDADAGAGGFYASCGYQERGRVSYKGNPLVYYELLLD